MTRRIPATAATLAVACVCSAALSGCQVRYADGHQDSPWYFIGLGVVFLAVAGRVVVQRLRLVHRGERVPGTVARVARGIVAGGNASTYRPVLRFRTLDGRQVETTAATGLPAAAASGRQVTVLYDPRRPTRAVIDTFWARGTWIGVIFLVVGAGIVLLGAVSMAQR